MSTSPTLSPALKPIDRYERGVGYCRNNDCKKFNQDVFLFANQVSHFNCGVCHTQGMVVKEVGWPKDTENMVFSEVRIDFDYRPSLEPWVPEGRYTQLAIVRDESCPNQNVYYLHSPVIRTDKRALATAESILGNLCQFPEDVLRNSTFAHRTKDTIIDFDLPTAEVKAKLTEVGDRLARSGLAKGNK